MKTEKPAGLEGNALRKRRRRRYGRADRGRRGDQLADGLEQRRGSSAAGRDDGGGGLAGVGLAAQDNRVRVVRGGRDSAEHDRARGSGRGGTGELQEIAPALRTAVMTVAISIPHYWGLEFFEPRLKGLDLSGEIGHPVSASRGCQ